MTRAVRILVILVSVAMSSRAMAQQPEPFQAVGTWKLNPSKSSGTSNQLKSRSRVHIVESRGGGVVVNRIETVDAEGVKSTAYFTTKADGTDYPMITIRSNGTTNVGSMSETRVDAYTIKWAIKNSEGKVAAEGTRTVSKDGQMMTLGTLVYDRVR